MLVDRPAALEFITGLFMFFKATPENAATVATHLVESSEMGLRSHGVMRVPQYVEDIERGDIKPDATPTTVLKEGGRIGIDGNHCFGQVAGVAMATKAIELAEEHGLALVTGCNFG